MNQTLKECVAAMHNKQELKEIVEHGCSGGTSLIYYRETVIFYDKWKDEIWELLFKQMEEIGETTNIMEFIASFNGSKDVGSEMQFKNLLCWYAIEEMAKEIVGIE